MIAVVGIDPGPTLSGLVVLGDRGVVTLAKVATSEWLCAYLPTVSHSAHVAIEVVESFGAKVWQQVFDTVEMVGVFKACLGRNFDQRLGRRAVRMHICGTMKSDDTQIRNVLLDRYGGSRQVAVGTKKAPGPLYGVKSHCWAALAVAVTARDMLNGQA